VQALYSSEPILPMRCDPTRRPCSPFLLISSYSYVAASRQERYAQLLHRIRDHVDQMPQSFIVFEDFDRFDCTLRDFIRDVWCSFFLQLPLSWTGVVTQRCVMTYVCR
jgi:hypothetical protein